MKNIALICVTHDPSGNNIDLLKKHTPQFSKIYNNYYICVSHETDPALIAELETIGFHIQIIKKSGVANARRAVVEFGMSGDNKTFSLELGKEADVTAGSCLFSRKCAALISLHSKDKMTDAEWPMIVHRIGEYRVDYLAVEGLEYQEKTNGYAYHMDESDKWFGRVRLCYLISESAMNTGKTHN